MNNSIVLWDYWIDNKLMMAYCIGMKNNVMYFFEAPVKQLYYQDDNQGESWKNSR